MGCLLLDAINAHMHDGTCPTSGSLGECPALIEARAESDWVRVQLVLSIWDASFNSATTVEAWLEALGATCVEISHVLLDRVNETVNGVGVDQTRTWDVHAWFPAGTAILSDLLEIAPDNRPDPERAAFFDQLRNTARVAP